MRVLAFLIYLAVFFAELVGLFFIPNSVWNETYLSIFFLAPILFTFLNVLMAWWIYSDEDEIYALRQQIFELENKLREKR